MSSMVGDFFGLGNNVVERSILEARRCAPIVLHHNGEYMLVFPSELLEQDSLAVLTSFSEQVFLLLNANRASFVFGSSFPFRVLINNLSLEEIRSILTTHANIGPQMKVTYGLSPTEELALQLMKLAKLLPSALVINMKFSNDKEMLCWCMQNNVLHLDGAALHNHQENYKLREVCRSHLFLHDSITSEIIVYRSNIGEAQHYAIVIGNPDFYNPAVRIHSSCYTGDLLGSLSCDCRGQLLLAVESLGNGGGGVILYISQEGRGIGLANKIRTYNLQMQNGLDTVDANRFLGFNDDERVFLPAALILRKLGISKLQLLTSNPNKVSSMSNYGILITRMIPFSGKMNRYNSCYVMTKRKRLGHVN